MAMPAAAGDEDMRQALFDYLACDRGGDSVGQEEEGQERGSGSAAESGRTY